MTGITEITLWHLCSCMHCHVAWRLYAQLKVHRVWRCVVCHVVDMVIWRAVSFQHCVVIPQQPALMRGRIQWCCCKLPVISWRHGNRPCKARICHPLWHTSSMQSPEEVVHSPGRPQQRLLSVFSSRWQQGKTEFFSCGQAMYKKLDGMNSVLWENVMIMQA